MFNESENPGFEDLKSDNLKLELSESGFMDNQEKEAFEFTKMINSSIRKAFIKMGVAVGAIVLAIVMFVISMPNIMDSFYYDPTEIVGKKGSNETNRISLDLATYSEIFLPGYYRYGVVADGNGNGKYRCCGKLV